MTGEELMDEVALLALGVLPAGECAAVRAAMARDPELRREYESLRAAADAIAFLAEEPVDSARSARMRERLLARVRGGDAGAAVRRFRAAAPWYWGTGLAAAAALVLAFVSVVQDVGLRGDLAQQQRRSVALQTQLRESERVAAGDRRTLVDLLAPDARRLDVNHGTVVVRGSRVYFALSTLPPVPRGKVYQAWYLAKGAKAMTPSVTFSPSAQGVAVVELPVDASRVGAVALSVEPDGGSKAPTSAPTFVRPLS